jgi:hypothetical protein
MDPKDAENLKRTREQLEDLRAAIKDMEQRQIRHPETKTGLADLKKQLALVELEILQLETGLD